MNAEQKLAIQLKLKKSKALLDEADVLFQNRFCACIHRKESGE